jgi:hypothetical protein
MRNSRKRAPKFSGRIVQLLERGKGPEVRPTNLIMVEVGDDPPSEEVAHYREIVLRHEYLFDGDLRSEYEKAKQLVQNHNSAISDDEFRFRLGEIVYLHRRRHSNPEYNKKIDQLVKNANTATELIGRIWDDLAQLDHEYRNVVLRIASRLISEEITAMSPDLAERKTQLAQLIVFAEHISSVFHQALELGTHVIREVPSSTKPKSPYGLEAYKLSELWFFLTGEQVVYPRAVEGEVSPHDSTEFVRLCIKMIDSKCTRAQAHTSMINARDKRKQFEKFVLSDAGSEMAQAIRRLID